MGGSPLSHPLHLQPPAPNASVMEDDDQHPAPLLPRPYPPAQAITAGVATAAIGRQLQRRSGTHRGRRGRGGPAQRGEEEGDESGEKKARDEEAWRGSLLGEEKGDAYRGEGSGEGQLYLVGGG
ncbi:hypothetical protein PR202_gb27411 [Eleusine coracana subsp. coracana]|uniref:Uncharacterized protein n=1 Tax=Eleusine coracana subsp. coracana TaxID=191504 RepID=A0AAV5FUG1_ELECO|nr:hypothetical protein PR202_gb27411 [Eleusine coracana subsp. coracana]